jgi:hypothetical protein
MNLKRSLALPALMALGGLGLWSSSAAAQYGGGVTAYAPGYYYAPVPVYYGRTYDYAPRSATGPHYYVLPARYYVAPPPTSQPALVDPGVSSGWSYSAPARFGRAAPSHTFGLEPESLPAEIAEEIAPATAAQRLAPTWHAPWWRGRIRWKRTRTNW